MSSVFPLAANIQIQIFKTNFLKEIFRQIFIILLYSSTLIIFTNSTRNFYLYFQQFVWSEFSEEYTPTERRETFYPSVVLADRLYELKITDLPAIPYFPVSSHLEWTDFRYYGLRSATAYVLVFDLSNQDTFQVCAPNEKFDIKYDKLHTGSQETEFHFGRVSESQQTWVFLPKFFLQVFFSHENYHFASSCSRLEVAGIKV